MTYKRTTAKKTQFKQNNREKAVALSFPTSCLMKPSAKNSIIISVISVDMEYSGL
jgi:hypothetical protein